MNQLAATFVNYISIMVKLCRFTVLFWMGHNKNEPHA